MEIDSFHRHYLLQAQWLAGARAHLFRRAALATRRRILDFGCGTGALTAEAARLSSGEVLGVDRDERLIGFARRTYPGVCFEAGDEESLLSGHRRFDLILLHFVLLWQPRPAPFLAGLKRLLDEGGILLLLAEPDYGGRIDHPEALQEMARVFIDHIRAGHGDPFIGRKIHGLLLEAGFHAQTEVIAQQPAPSGPIDRQQSRDEWRFWQELGNVPPRQVRRLRRIENQALRQGRRVMFMPVFCSLARPRPGQTGGR
jgi:SAM-dependent methyltransferase